ncbi:MAG: mechanosensitive ion channel domain-containing protein, partial [Bacteroidota bacterium]
MKKAIFFILFLGAFYFSTAQQKDTAANMPGEVAAVDSSATDRPDTISQTRETAVTEVVQKVEKDLKPPLLSEIFSVGKIVWSLIFLVLGYFILRFIGFVFESIAEKTTKYRITIKGFIPIVKILGWMFILFIVIAGIIQPPISTVIAVTASIAIAVGFAAQDILKNIFGGIIILIDRPFLVGDKIEIGNYYGEVVEIGLRSTRLVTPDDSRVSVPNGELMNKSVSNANVGEPNCQVVAEIYLPIT